MTDRIVQRLLVGIIVVVAVGMAVHTPLTLWAGLQLPEYALVIKAWKEILMGIGLALLIYAAARTQKVQALLADRLMQLSLVYSGLHFVMMAIFQHGLDTAGAGLLIDLRYVLLFVLVYGTLYLYPVYRQLILRAFALAAAVIIGFALLQVFVLPKDVLATIGYSKETISPYLTVDDNEDYIRINGTLRGPNPLGAYAVIVIGLAVATAMRWKLGRRGVWLVIGGSAAAGVMLGASHSRSAMIAAAVALLAAVVIAAKPQVRRRIVIAASIVGVIGLGALYLLRDTSFVANVILHDDPHIGAEVTSNAGHVDSLQDGTERMLRQPLGAGVGSTGSASLIGSNPLIIENQYLFIAHEVGWLGLVVFAWLFGEILRRLYMQRKSALALGVFASGIGLAVIGLLLPVWVDDTVSITWWGLAAVGVLKMGNRGWKTKKAGSGKKEKNHGV